MHTAGVVLAAIVALLHLYFLVLESFLWTTPRGMKIFKLTAEKAELTKSLAQNQGLYNGFLAAGILWALVGAPDQLLARATFFLVCVVVAGIVGALTAARQILFVQALPAALALGALWLGRA